MSAAPWSGCCVSGWSPWWRVGGGDPRPGPQSVLSCPDTAQPWTQPQPSPHSSPLPVGPNTHIYSRISVSTLIHIFRYSFHPCHNFPTLSGHFDTLLLSAVFLLSPLTRILRAKHCTIISMACFPCLRWRESVSLGIYPALEISHKSIACITGNLIASHVEIFSLIQMQFAKLPLGKVVTASTQLIESHCHCHKMSAPASQFSTQ